MTNFLRPPVLTATLTMTVLLSLIFTPRLVHSRLLPIRLPVAAAGPAAASVGTRVIFAGGQTSTPPYNSGVVCFDARSPNVTLSCPALATSRVWTANSVVGDEALHSPLFTHCLTVKFTGVSKPIIHLNMLSSLLGDHCLLIGAAHDQFVGENVI